MLGALFVSAAAFLPCAPLSLPAHGAVRSAAPVMAVGRREAVWGASLCLLAAPGIASADSPAAAATKISESSKLMKALLDKKEDFIVGLEDGDSSAPQLPATVPLATFQALENTADPEFMEIAIDYLEAMRNARDLVKLAKLTKSKVTVTSKEVGKPRTTVEAEYGEAAGPLSARSYGERATEEVLGASLALEAAMKAMGPTK